MIDSDGYKYWRSKRAIGRIRSPTWFHRPIESYIETTAYGLLTTMIMADKATVLSNGRLVVQWLNEEMNYKGGFVSTQVGGSAG